MYRESIDTKRHPWRAFIKARHIGDAFACLSLLTIIILSQSLRIANNHGSRSYYLYISGWVDKNGSNLAINKFDPTPQLYVFTYL